MLGECEPLPSFPFLPALSQTLFLSWHSAAISLSPLLAFWKPDILCKTRIFQSKYCCYSVTQLCPALCEAMDCSTPGFLVLHYLPRVLSNSYPLSLWCHPIISSTIAPFSSCCQSFPASGSFSLSQIFASDGQSIGTSTSASVLPMKSQDWFPLGLTGLISLQFKGLSRVSSSTSVQKHQFFDTQPSLWSNSRIHTWLLEKP